MFRYSTIIRELALNLAKVIFTLQQTQSHSAQQTIHTPFHGKSKLPLFAYLFVNYIYFIPLFWKYTLSITDMLPHNRTINNDVISPNVLT